MSDTIRIEEVDAVTPPPRARVEDAVEPRQRDYLSGFLQQKPQGDAPGEPGGALYEGVIEALKEIYDPEIPVNIYDLGLIYELKVKDSGDVDVLMTLTAPACPVAGSLPKEVADVVAAVEGVGVASVTITWDPPWTPANMSEVAKVALDMF